MLLTDTLASNMTGQVVFFKILGQLFSVNKNLLNEYFVFSISYLSLDLIYKIFSVLTLQENKIWVFIKLRDFCVPLHITTFQNQLK